MKFQILVFHKLIRTYFYSNLSEIPTFDETVQDFPDNTMNLMENQLKSEQEKFENNEKDLAKLRALSEHLERQMHGLTMSSNTSRASSIVVKDFMSTDSSKSAYQSIILKSMVTSMDTSGMDKSIIVKAGKIVNRAYFE